MATWYTDNITGNDTTGDGTIATPYKTIAKAVSVAANDDTINVAGSGYTSVAGTLTFNTPSASTATTSRDMTADLPVGTIFTVDDPAWGARKSFFKVRSITATTITFSTNASMQISTSIGGIEKVTTNMYTTASTGQNLDDLTGLNKTGIKLEGGWTGGFTAQDGVTWFVYTGTTATSGTALRVTGGNMYGLSINNFGFGGVTGLNSYLGSGADPIKYGNLYTASGTFVFTNFAVAHSNGCNFYLGTSAGFTNIGGDVEGPQTLVINNIYAGSSRLIGGTAGSYMCANVINLYTKSVATTGYTNNTASLQKVNFDIENWYATFTLLNSQDQNIALAFYGNIILRNIERLGPTGSTGKRPIWLKDYPDANIQVIAPTQNVDDWGIQTKSYVVHDFGLTGFNPILDIEGEKQFYGGGSIVFADPTVYETGTNSYRVNRSLYSGVTTCPSVPVKSIYITDGTAKTISIRYKSSSTFNVRWHFLPNGTTNFGTTYGPKPEQITQVTADWTTVTYTIPTEYAAELAGTYIQFCIAAADNWTSPYIWIDSVTIS